MTLGFRVYIETLNKKEEGKQKRREEEEAFALRVGCVRECPVPLSRIQKSRASIVSRVGLAASGSERAKERERERERETYIYI